MSARGNVTPPTGPRVLILQHGADDPPGQLGDWFTEAGAQLEVRRCFAGDPVPTGADGFDALISLGGAMGARDDADAPWLPATRALLAATTAAGVPTLGICLGAQLLAAATGGSVTRGANGPEIGAYLVAKRDAAEVDPLCADLPMTPDVLHYHHDVVDRLPPGAVLLYSGTGYPHQAFRVGARSWGLQFHIEVTAEDLRGWARAEGVWPLTPDVPPGLARRLGPALDDAAEAVAVVWRVFVQRFVALAGAPSETPDALLGRRLPLAAPDGTPPDRTPG